SEFWPPRRQDAKVGGFVGLVARRPSNPRGRCHVSRAERGLLVDTFLLRNARRSFGGFEPPRAPRTPRFRGWEELRSREDFRGRAGVVRLLVAMTARSRRVKSTGRVDFSILRSWRPWRSWRFKIRGRRAFFDDVRDGTIPILRGFSSRARAC